MTSVDLYWLPLGAGGHFVRFNGKVYEAIAARREGRERRDLYHTALVVTMCEERFVVENSWPIPDGDGAARGVVVEGPVGDARLSRFRAFRYEVRCWRDGIIADICYAVASPQPVTTDGRTARRVLELARDVPALPWGRRHDGAAEMWNSNSVISWLLARSGLPAHEIVAPPGGRAPGWSTGIEMARRSLDVAA